MIAADTNERARWVEKLAGKLGADELHSTDPRKDLEEVLARTVAPQLCIATLRVLEDDVRRVMARNEGAS